MGFQSGPSGVSNQSGAIDLTAALAAKAATSDLATAGGLVLITTQSFTTASAVNVNNCFTSTYDNYRIALTVTGTAADTLYYKSRLSGTDASTNYNYQRMWASGATLTGSRTTGITLGCMVGFAAGTASVYQIDVFGPALAAATAAVSVGSFASAGSSLELLNSVGNHTTATAYDGFSLIPGSGTITGTLSVFGYKK